MEYQKKKKYIFLNIIKYGESLQFKMFILWIYTSYDSYNVQILTFSITLPKKNIFVCQCLYMQNMIIYYSI